MGLLAVLYLSFGAVPLALLAHFASSLASDAVSDQVRHRLTTTAATSAVVVEQRLSSLTELIAATANDSVLATAVASLGGATGELLRQRLRIVVSQPGITEALITDLAGRTLASEPDTQYFTDVSRTDWFVGARSRSGPFVSAAYVPTFPDARRAVAVVAPIRDSARTTVALLAVAYSLDALQDFAGRIATAQGIELLITDQTGVVVARPDRDVSLIVSMIEDRRVSMALAGKSAYVREQTPLGWQLSATEPVARLGWTVTATVDEHRALSPARQIRSAVLTVSGILAGVLLAGLGLQIWLAAMRRRAERRLQQARDEAVRVSEFKSRFLATVSHEIRTPMNGILGLTRLLRDTRLDEEQRRYTDATAGAAEGLLAVVNDLLDLSRIEAGRFSLAVAPFDIRRLCREAVELLEPRARSQGLAVDTTVDGNVPERLVGDATRIRQVLLNLVGNAVKFTPAGRVSLSVSAEAVGGEGPVWVTFSVQDTGLGLTDEQRAHVFDRFVRDADERLEGAGLGLTISNELVALMDGQIGLESVPGVGSRFWFRLALDGTHPAIADPPTPLPIDSIEPVPAGQFGRVLVADDDDVNRLVARMVLRRAGFKVDVVGSGAEAIAAARARRYDIVLLDLHMPGLDGMAVSRAIRSQGPPDSRVPLVAMTASATAADRERCLAAGMDGFAAKPIDWEHLVTELRLRVWRGDGTLSADEATELCWDEQALTDLRRCGALDEAVETFAATAPVSAERIAAAIGSGDVASAAELAHRLAGSAATVGAAGLARRCARLSDRVQEQDRQPDERLVAEAAALGQAVAQALTALDAHRLPTA
ncbi:hypothetical protein GCM10022255_107080 [Dactylosporangium darangshiense]|uniref:histidine kinase n=1 Tax=Dactylosporangium darangshiense TaxID=579108 RepID=A0ABP8DU57_9ACTN